MTDWKPGDRVEHQTFGAGTVLECNDQHTLVHFDDRGRKKLASHLVVLTPLTAPAGRLPPRQAESRQPAAPIPTEARSTVTDVPSTIDELIDLARTKVGSADSLNEFVSSMRGALAGSRHAQVGALSGMRVQQFQNWLLDENWNWQLTDAQLLAVMRVEFPLPTGQVHVGDADTGLKQISGIRANYNRAGHHGPSSGSRGLPPSKSYGTF
ncbi:MAG: hypothetical protein ABMA15_09080 [Vicinamibacterales bacterium]